MCLKTVTKIYKTPLKKVRIGYKIMKNCEDETSNTFNSQYYPFKRNKKIGSTVVCKLTETSEEYPLGFHIYKSVPKFLVYPNEMIIIVCYTNIVCTGKQNGLNVDVAKQMTFIRILED